MLVPGHAQKWFVVAGLSLQRSEPAKLTLVLWGAHVLLARRGPEPRGRPHGWQTLLPVVPVAGGSSVIVSMTSLGLLPAAARDEPEARVALARGARVGRAS